MEKIDTLKNILIISPHFPPSNLAAVHRSRLFAQHLPSFGWNPIVLAVHENYYEEKLDLNLQKLLPDGLRVEKVKALAVTRPRLIGDIGLRAFFQLYRRAKKIIQEEKIDFLYIPIPSFYVALLGRMLHESTGVRYGIDYIDPWVHSFAGSEKILSRHWFATKLSGLLEPIAVKKSALITGVAEGYYKGVQERNPELMRTAVFGAMPYGAEATDHRIVKKLGIQPYLFENKSEKLQLVYAGAMLPKAYEPLEQVFKAIADEREHFKDIEIHFIGSGKIANDPNSHNVKPLAEKYGLWETIVFEYPQRIPYFDVLIHLEAADGVFIIGSTERHYTPSKVYQGVLSGKPILAVLHNDSSACEVVNQTKAGIVIGFDGTDGLESIYKRFKLELNKFRTFVTQFTPVSTDNPTFQEYSANSITKTLSVLLKKVTT
jgi:hypothetical protein